MILLHQVNKTDDRMYSGVRGDIVVKHSSVNTDPNEIPPRSPFLMEVKKANEDEMEYDSTPNNTTVDLKRSE